MISNDSFYFVGQKELTKLACQWFFTLSFLNILRSSLNRIFF